MENKPNELIMDKLTKVCICKAISRATIKKAIAEGAKTVGEVQKKTGAGSGGCQGRRCTQKIQELINEVNNNKI